MKLRPPLQAEAAAAEDSFSTNCPRCRLLIKSDRKHIGQILVCRSCRNSFKAVEVSQDANEANAARRSSRIRVTTPIRGKTNAGEVENDSEITLAQLRLKSKKNKKPRVSEESQEDAILVLPSSDMEVMKVEDSDFYDFDKDRTQSCFKHGQVWAIYDDDDGMPRHYGLIEEILSVNPFAVRMSWLDLHHNGDQTLLTWEKMGLHVSCGLFKVSKPDIINLVNVFSHTVNCERVARSIYRVFPRKGSIWALYKVEEGTNRCYEIAVLLTSYSEVYGISMVYLEKVDGFRAVFRKKGSGNRAVRWVEKFDFREFSHEVPARKLCGDGVSGDLEGCWELDPAALPQDLLAIERGS